LRLPILALALFSASAAPTQLKPRPSEPTTPTAPALPITRVALYKNGVGFFEHSGRVSGDQSVTIDFTSAQLNDVLQSLTAIDLNGGRISGAGYNSTTPLEEQLKTLPLALDANPTDTSFYNAIRGARVQLTAPGASFTGRLLSIDLGNVTTQSHDLSVATQEHMFATIVSDAGQVRTIELTSAVTVTLLDTALHTDVTRYLELLASTRSQGLRHLTLLDRGTGNRDLRVSYISEVPVWKSTYRILFTDSKQTTDPTATLQGWSVVDNTTGSDWINVHLDLIAGAPQSFIQPLSIPLYARRPEIAMPGEQQLAPQTFQSGEMSASGATSIQGTVTDPTGATVPNAQITATNASTGQQAAGRSDSAGNFRISVPQTGSYNVNISAPGFNSYAVTGINVNQNQASQLRAKLNIGSASQTIEVTADAANLNTESASYATLGSGYIRKRSQPVSASRPMMMALPPPPPVADYAEAAQSSLTPKTSSSAFDDFFQYSLTDPITIRKNESALVPILQTKLPIERVTLWSARQPVALRALWVTNASNLTLDHGSFSIVENGNFGGEGLLDPIHPGEKRLLSYAADQAVRVDNQTGAGQHKLRSVVIAKGILTEQYTDVVERDYGVRNAAPEARTVIVEHARTNGYALSPTAKPDETLPNAYRFRVQVPAGQTVHLKVAESRAYPRTVQVSSLNDQQVRVILYEMGQQPTPDARFLQQFAPVFAAQRVVADLEARKTALDGKLETLDSEELRQRNNILALKDADKASQKRFVDQLGKIEDQILTLQKQQETLATQLEAAEQDRSNKVDALQFSQTIEP
jgi:hypothetical protein